MAELIGPDPGREALVVDEGGDGLAEAVAAHLGHPEVVADLAPLLPEIDRVAQAWLSGEYEAVLAVIGDGLSISQVASKVGVSRRVLPLPNYDSSWRRRC